MIDRFEEAYAVCESEDKGFIHILKSELPLNIKEGDCLIQNEKGFFLIDEMNTENRKREINSRMKKLFEG